MSVQLILFPQIAWESSNFAVDGINFTNIVSAYATSSITPAQDTIINSPPSLVNSWYSYYTIAGGGWGAVAQPSVTTGTLWLFYNGATTGRTGVYQQLSGLTIGQSYNIVVNTTTAVAGGTLRIETYTGSLLQTSGSSGTMPTQIIAPFVANSANDTILIEYEGTTSVLYIESIYVIQTSVPPTSEYEGQVIVDLYEDEDIPITLSIDEFKNVAEQVQSYSKAFNLPATKRNNQIFTNLFEVTMVQDVFSFNPYLQTRCILKQDGYILFDGYLRLIDIQDKEAEISYNVNLYSEVIALADILQNKTFADLDFSELEHDYQKTNIKLSWTTGIGYTFSSTSGFRDGATLRYPFVDWTHQYTLDPVTDYPILPNLESVFRPFINIKYLINRIFSQADVPFSWTSAFFDSADFGELYMDFNWGETEYGAVPDRSGNLEQTDSGSSDWYIQTAGFKKLRFDTTVSGDNSLWDNTSYIFQSDVPNLEVTVCYYIKLESTASIYTYSNNLRIAKFDASGNHLETFIEDNNSIAAGATKTMGSPPNLFGVCADTFATTLGQGEYIQAQSKVATSNKIRMYSNDSTLWFQWTNVGSQVDTLLQSAREDLVQWDFLKGIMTMFNLVSMPDKDNPSNINFEPYGDVFINNTNSSQLDWTTKVDVSEMKLTPLADLNKTTIFKFVEDDDDYAFNVYKKSVDGHLYGSKVYDASGLTLLEGTDEVVAEPFAATVIKPLDPIFSNFIVPTLYAMDDDGVTAGFENSPRIMYNNGVKSSGITYYIPAQNGLGQEDQPEFLQFSHLTDIPTIVSSPPATTDTRDFHFGECQLITPVGNPSANNLFNLYWLPYYNELYNPNTRTMSLKVNLNPSDINTFKFYDTVFIKNRTFRVNKIEYKPNDLATVEFILIP